MAAGALVQIGEVAERTGLSLRTIRYYEEVGLVVPSARSQGGFRLYTETDIERLQLIKRMKPLDLTLEQTRELLSALDRADTGSRLTTAERARLASTLRGYREFVQARCAALREDLVTAEAFDKSLTEHLHALD
jgi:MerR family transcriptional regulator, copper efflux regulator